MDFIYLSRRNLLTLLSKLDRKEAGEKTECAIIKYRQDGAHVPFNQTPVACVVVAVSDDEFYNGQTRPAGMMHPADDPANKA
jgi:hypothetical protein